MKVQIASLCMLVLHLSEIAWAKPGFIKTTDPLIPAAVKEASKSVFKLYSPAGRFDQTLAMKDALVVSKKKAELKATNDGWETLQLEYCARAKTDDCPLFAQLGEGSIFLVGNKNTLYTNLHNFYEILSTVAKARNASSRAEIFRSLDRRPLFMAAINSDQKLVFDPTIGMAHLTFFNPDAYLFDGTKDSMLNPFGSLSDFVEIKTSTPIDVPPLKMATQKPKVGDVLYLIGFPRETNDRESIGGQDSDGESQFVTVGKVMSVQTWSLKTENTIPQMLLTVFDKYMIFVDSDCEHGNSGGPIVNEKGEVVGIVLGFWKDTTLTPNTRICGGLDITDRNKLNALWDQFSN